MVMELKTAWKNKLPEKFYNDLVKCDFVKILDQMVKTESPAHIDVEDVLQLSAGEVVGTISQNMITPEEDYHIHLISDQIPNECLFYMVADKNVSVETVKQLLNKLRKYYRDIEITYGISYHSEETGVVEIDALLVHKQIGNLNFSEEQPTGDTRDWQTDNEIMDQVAVFYIDHPITIRNIQDHFGLGFNRAQRIVNRLEQLEIISKATETASRKILITDKEEIHKRIYQIK